MSLPTTTEIQAAIDACYNYFQNNQADSKPAACNLDGIPYHVYQDLWEWQISPSSTTSECVSLLCRAMVACGKTSYAETLADFMIDNLTHDGVETIHWLVNLYDSGVEMDSVFLGNYDNAVFTFTNGVATIPAGAPWHGDKVLDNYASNYKGVRGCFTTATEFPYPDYFIDPKTGGTEKTVASYAVDGSGCTITLDDTGFSGDLQVFYVYRNGTILNKYGLYRTYPVNTPAIVTPNTDYQLSCATDAILWAYDALKDLAMATGTSSYLTKAMALRDKLEADTTISGDDLVIFDAENRGLSWFSVGKYDEAGTRNINFTFPDKSHTRFNYDADATNKAVSWNIGDGFTWTDGGMDLKIRGENNGKIGNFGIADNAYNEYVCGWLDNSTSDKTYSLTKESFISRSGMFYRPGCSYGTPYVTTDASSPTQSYEDNFSSYIDGYGSKHPVLHRFNIGPVGGATYHIVGFPQLTDTVNSTINDYIDIVISPGAYSIRVIDADGVVFHYEPPEDQEIGGNGAMAGDILNVFSAFFEFIKRLFGDRPYLTVDGYLGQNLANIRIPFDDGNWARTYPLDAPVELMHPSMVHPIQTIEIEYGREDKPVVGEVFSQTTADIAYVGVGDRTVIDGDDLQYVKFETRDTDASYFDVSYVAVPNSSTDPYPNAGATLFTLEYSEDGLMGWRGPTYTGYTNSYAWLGSLKNVQSALQLYIDAQDDYISRHGTTGPFSPVFLRDLPENKVYGTLQEFTWTGPDPNTFWGGFQYRALAHAAETYYYDQYLTYAEKTTLSTILSRWKAYLKSFMAANSNEVPSTYAADGTITADYVSPDFYALVGRAALFMYMANKDTDSLNILTAMADKLLAMQQSNGAFYSIGANIYNFHQAESLLFLGQLKNSIESAATEDIIFDFDYDEEYTSSISFETAIFSYRQGGEQRQYKYQYPVRRWTLTFENTPTQRSSLEAFFRSVKGRYGTFKWTWETGKGGDGVERVCRFVDDTLAQEILIEGYSMLQVTLEAIDTENYIAESTLPTPKEEHGYELGYVNDLDDMLTNHRQADHHYGPRRRWTLEYECSPATFQALQAFFIDKKGQWAAFNWAWPLAIGGDGNNYIVRFDTDELRINHKIESHGMVRFSLIEVPQGVVVTRYPNWTTATELKSYSGGGLDNGLYSITRFNNIIVGTYVTLTKIKVYRYDIAIDDWVHLENISLLVDYGYGPRKPALYNNALYYAIQGDITEGRLLSIDNTLDASLITNTMGSMDEIIDIVRFEDWYYMAGALASTGYGGIVRTQDFTTYEIFFDIYNAIILNTTKRDAYTIEELFVADNYLYWMTSKRQLWRYAPLQTEEYDFIVALDPVPESSSNSYNCHGASLGNAKALISIDDVLYQRNESLVPSDVNQWAIDALDGGVWGEVMTGPENLEVACIRDLGDRVAVGGRNTLSGNAVVYTTKNLTGYTKIHEDNANATITDVYYNQALMELWIVGGQQVYKYGLS